MHAAGKYAPPIIAQIRVKVGGLAVANSLDQSVKKGVSPPSAARSENDGV
jgi:hypothetical protein